MLETLERNEARTANMGRKSIMDGLRALTATFAAPCLLPRQNRGLWGAKTFVRPALVAREFGKADLLLALAPIQYRPAYYLVWVDAQWLADDTMIDHVDEIYEAIAEEFGSHREEFGRYEWPMEDFKDGSCWRKACAGDVMTVRLRRKVPLS